MSDEPLDSAPERDLGGNTERNTAEPEVIPPPNSRLANLRPAWQKGQSGNRNGRPKSKPLTKALTRQLSKKVPPDMLAKISLQSPQIHMVIGKKPTYADIVAWSWIQQAVKGNGAALRNMLDRIEGRIPKEMADVADDRLDELMEALSIAPAPPGETNDDEPPPAEEVTV